VDIAGAQGTAFQVTELVEDEQRVIAGAAEVAVVGAALLIAVGRAHAGVHVQHDHLDWAAGMHGIDPAPGQVGERVQVRVLGQQLGLEAAHLTCRGGLFCCSPATDHPAHGWIVGQPVSVVHILIPGQSPEHGLAELSSQGMAAVRAGPGVGENKPSEFGQTKGIVEFPKSEQPGVGGDPGAMELQLEAAVESEPKNSLWRFTRKVLHSRTPTQRLSC
jgi:hypothetical protein